MLEGKREVPKYPDTEQHPRNAPHDIGTPMERNAENLPTYLDLKETLTDQCSYGQPRETTNTSVLVTAGRTMEGMKQQTQRERERGRVVCINSRF